MTETNTTQKAFIKFGGAQPIINNRVEALLAQTDFTGAALEALEGALASAELNVFESEFSSEPVTDEEAGNVVLYTFDQSILPTLEENLKYGDVEFDDVDEMVEAFDNILRK